MDDMAIASAQVGVAADTVRNWSKSLAHRVFAEHLKVCSDMIMALAKAEHRGFPDEENERILSLVFPEAVEAAFKEAEAAVAELGKVLEQGKKLDSSAHKKRTVF